MTRDIVNQYITDSAKGLKRQRTECAGPGWPGMAQQDGRAFIAAHHQHLTWLVVATHPKDISESINDPNCWGKEKKQLLNKL